MKTLQKKTELEDNPVGLDKSIPQEIIPELDILTSSMFILFHQYQKHHWLVKGPQFHDLHLILEAHYNEVHANLDAIAERITLLGGIPTSAPGKQVELSIVDHETEGYFPIRASLERDMKAEATIAKKLRETIKLANECGDFGTKALLEGVLMKVENRAHHLEHYLGDDSLQNKENLSAVH